MAGGASSDDDDAWFHAEPGWGSALAAEVRRLSRRAAARKVVVVVAALAMTGLIVMRVARRPQIAIAHVVIAVGEGSLSSGRDPIPVDQMQEYVGHALMPSGKLDALIEELDLFPLRHKLGPEFARGELTDMIDVTVYRNYFLVDNYDPSRQRTARIEIAAASADPHLAFVVAERIAQIIVETSQQVQESAAKGLTARADEILTRARADASLRDQAVAQKELELAQAEREGKTALVAGLRAELAQLAIQQHEDQRKLATLQTNVQMDRVEASAMAAGLDLQLEIVSERQPFPDTGHNVRLGIIAIVVLIIMVPVAAVAIGAFDPRIHDTGDVTRLGFSSLGHVPAFTGDRIGSLRARGIRRKRAAQY
jgi:hypothetical protein